MATTGETNDLKSEKTREKQKNKNEQQIIKSEVAEPTERELDVVTSVFKSFETGLREGTIFPKVNMMSGVTKDCLEQDYYLRTCTLH
jgi:hypothetical protein